MSFSSADQRHPAERTFHRTSNYGSEGKGKLLTHLPLQIIKNRKMKRVSHYLIEIWYDKPTFLTLGNSMFYEPT